MELEDALERNITQFLLELGNGFAFMGRQKERVRQLEDELRLSKKLINRLTEDTP